MQSDQTNDLMKLQYENLALKLDQVMSKMEDNGHKETQVVVDGNAGEDHFGYTFIDCDIPRAHLTEGLVPSAPDYADTRSSTGQSEMTNALFEHRVLENTPSQQSDINDIAVSIHSDHQHYNESNR